MAVKFLTVVVDGTAATRPHWPTIVGHYLEKVLSCIYGRSTDLWYFGLVMYKVHGFHNRDFLVRLNGWTNNVNLFIARLWTLNFSGGRGPNEAAIAQGLSQALAPREGAVEYQQYYASAEKHCLLVAASNPFILPNPVFLPALIKDGGGFSSLETNRYLADVETVARTYAQCGVSLSIISPKKLPTLRQLFNLANGPSTEEADVTVNNLHDFLVLISVKFPAAHAAIYEEQITMVMSACLFSPTYNTNATDHHQAHFPKTEVDHSLPPYSVTNRLSEEIRLFHQLLDDPTIYMEQFLQEKYSRIMPGYYAETLVNNTMSTRTYAPTNFGNQNQNLYHEAIVALVDFMIAKEGVSDNQAEEVADNNNIVPIINASGTFNISKPAGFQTRYTGQIRSEVFTGNSGMVQTTRESLIASPPSASSEVFSGVQGPSGLIGNMQPRMNPVRVGEASKRNVIGAFNQFVGESSEVHPVHGGMGPIALANLESEQDGYVLTWEGNITIKHRQQTIFIGGAKVYKKSSVPQTLTVDWPKILQLGQVIQRQAFNRLLYNREADIVVLEALAEHKIYKELKKRDLCVRMDLPSRTMIFSPTKDDRRFIGTLFRGHLPMFGPVTSRQQQPALRPPQPPKQEPNDQTESTGRIKRVRYA